MCVFHAQLISLAVHHSHKIPLRACDVIGKSKTAFRAGGQQDAIKQIPSACFLPGLKTGHGSILDIEGGEKGIRQRNRLIQIRRIFDREYGCHDFSERGRINPRALLPGCQNFAGVQLLQDTIRTVELLHIHRQGWLFGFRFSFCRFGGCGITGNNVFIFLPQKNPAGDEYGKTRDHKYDKYRAQTPDTPSAPALFPESLRPHSFLICVRSRFHKVSCLSKMSYRKNRLLIKEALPGT